MLRSGEVEEESEEESVCRLGRKDRVKGLCRQV